VNPGGWPESPRGKADPAVETWLARLLPALDAVRIMVSDGHGVTSDVALPGAAGIGLFDTVLDQPEVLRTRIELALPDGATMVHGRDPAWPATIVSFDELITMAGDLREVLARRALRQIDFLVPGSPPPAADERDGADLSARLAVVTTGLQTALDALQVAAAPFGTAVARAKDGASPDVSGIDVAQSSAVAALIQAMAYGVVVHVPSTREADDVLTAVRSAIAELQRRANLAAPSSTATTDELIAALKARLGNAQPALPRLTLEAGVGAVAAAALTRGDQHLQTDAELAEDWVTDAAGVRVQVDALLASLDSGDALSARGGSVELDRGRIAVNERPAPAAVESPITTECPSRTTTARMSSPCSGRTVDATTSDIVPAPRTPRITPASRSTREIIARS